MDQTAFQLAIAGLVTLTISFPVLVLLEERWITWGIVVVAFNFFSQSYMVMKEISLPYIAIPNIVVFVYFALFIAKMSVKHKQK